MLKEIFFFSLFSLYNIAFSQPFLPFPPGSKSSTSIIPLIPEPPFQEPEFIIQDFEWINQEIEEYNIEGETYIVIYEEATAYLATEEGVEAELFIDVLTLEGDNIPTVTVINTVIIPEDGNQSPNNS